MELPSRNRYTSNRSRIAETACEKVSYTWIQQLPLFAGRDPVFLKSLAEYMEVEMFTAGDDIMREGDEGDKMYLLHRGRVEVLVNEGAVSVAVLESGTVFGEMALFGSPRRSATIRAIEFCGCRVINHRVFHMLLRKFPTEQRYFAEIARDRRRKLEEIKHKGSSQDEGPPSRAVSARLSAVRLESNRSVVLPAAPPQRSHSSSVAVFRQPAAWNVSSSASSSNVALPPLPRLSQKSQANQAGPGDPDDQWMRCFLSDPSATASATARAWAEKCGSSDKIGSSSGSSDRVGLAKRGKGEADSSRFPRLLASLRSGNSKLKEEVGNLRGQLVKCMELYGPLQPPAPPSEAKASRAPTGVVPEVPGMTASSSTLSLR